VKRLQESLSRLEEFEVVTALQTSADTRRDNGATMLARQLKLRLVTDDPDIPRSCSNVVVSIHAIATFQAFNDYLRPRISAAAIDRATSSSAPTSRSGLAGALAAFSAAAGMSEPREALLPGRLSSSFGSQLTIGGSSPPTTQNAAQSIVRRRSSRLTAKASNSDLAGSPSSDSTVNSIGRANQSEPSPNVKLQFSSIHLTYHFVSDTEST